MTSHLTRHHPSISKSLQAFLKEQKQQHQNHFWTKDFFPRLEKYMSHGKMIRGSLILELFLLFSENENDAEDMPTAVLQTALAMEFLQAALLMHDDILDQDALRRGQPAMHTQYDSWAKNEQYPNPRHFGAGMAICGGDIALGFCFSLLANLEIDIEIKFQLQSLFSQELVGVALAEAHDFEMAFTKRAISKKEILEMYRDKTGRYSLSLPMMAGAILARQPNEIISQIEKIGESLGTIFQIKDDEIGLFGNENETGKPAGNDIREGKKTLFWFYLQEMTREKTPTSTTKNLLHLFGKPTLNEKEVNSIRQFMQQSMIPEKIRADILTLSEDVETLLHDLTISETKKNFFRKLLKYSKQRIQ